jgi:GR25 family glycosyltransferase involved in LPS biosynthesis
MAALHEVAKFIWENNKDIVKWPHPAISSVFEVQTKIKEEMYYHAMRNAKLVEKEKAAGKTFDHEWVYHTASAGYYILYSLEDTRSDQITIEVTILADLTVGHRDYGFVQEVVDLSEQTS